jgi:sugar phosphate isomerase/epimerase
MRRVTIYLSEEEFQELRRRAARRGMTISALVRLSVARLVEREGEREGLGRVVEGLERLRMEVEELRRRLDKSIRIAEPSEAAAGEERAGEEMKAHAAPERPDSPVPSFLRDNPWLHVLSEAR